MSQPPSVEKAHTLAVKSANGASTVTGAGSHPTSTDGETDAPPPSYAAATAPTGAPPLSGTYALPAPSGFGQYQPLSSGGGGGYQPISNGAGYQPLSVPYGQPPPSGYYRQQPTVMVQQAPSGGVYINTNNDAVRRAVSGLYPCHKCHAEYPLPPGATSFRCQRCGYFNALNGDQCAIL
jgi:LSD1 subclass zinc finger protein